MPCLDPLFVFFYPDYLSRLNYTFTYSDLGLLQMIDKAGQPVSKFYYDEANRVVLQVKSLPEPETIEYFYGYKVCCKTDLLLV